LEALETTVAEGSTADNLPVARAAARALVFLSVPWSSPERNARQAFRAAASLLVEHYADLGIHFFMLDEEDEACQTWLASLGVPHFGGGFARGAGGLFWLEHGRVVSSKITANSLSAGGRIARSVSLWRGRAKEILP
jgi:hypothetical protein